MDGIVVLLDAEPGADVRGGHDKAGNAAAAVRALFRGRGLCAHVPFGLCLGLCPCELSAPPPQAGHHSRSGPSQVRFITRPFEV